MLAWRLPLDAKPKLTQQLVNPYHRARARDIRINAVEAQMARSLLLPGLLLGAATAAGSTTTAFLISSTPAPARGTAMRATTEPSPSDASSSSASSSPRVSRSQLLQRQAASTLLLGGAAALLLGAGPRAVEAAVPTMQVGSVRLGIECSRLVG